MYGCCYDENDMDKAKREGLQEAEVVITDLKEAYLKYFNLHHTLAVQEAGIKGILCDALKIEHCQHDLYELSQMVTAKLKDLETQIELIRNGTFKEAECICRANLCAICANSMLVASGRAK